MGNVLLMVTHFVIHLAISWIGFLGIGLFGGTSLHFTYSEKKGIVSACSWSR